VPSDLRDVEVLKAVELDDREEGRRAGGRARVETGDEFRKCVQSIGGDRGALGA